MRRVAALVALVVATCSKTSEAEEPKTASYVLTLSGVGAIGASGGLFYESAQSEKNNPSGDGSRVLRGAAIGLLSVGGVAMVSGVVLPLTSKPHHWRRPILASAGLALTAVAIPHLVVGTNLLGTVSAGGAETFTWLGGALLATGATASLLGVIMFAVGAEKAEERTETPRETLRPGAGLTHAGIALTAVSIALGLAGGGFMIGAATACCASDFGLDGNRATLGFVSLGLLSGSALTLAAAIPMMVVGANNARAKISVGPTGAFVSGEF
jgi:hypothetical protein